MVSNYSDQGYPFPHYLVVSDVGISKQFDLLPEVVQTSNVGTPFTMALEVRTNKYDQRADVYSLGCIYYKMLTMEYPFNGETLDELNRSKCKDTLKVVPNKDILKHK